jgi:hypothetical protein
MARHLRMIRTWSPSEACLAACLQLYYYIFKRSVAGCMALKNAEYSISEFLNF